MGKTIKQYHYLPILDDRNLNDMGIDVNGHSFSELANGDIAVAYIEVQPAGAPASQYLYFRGQDNDATLATAKANALLEAKANFNAWAYSMGYTVVQANTAADYTALKALVVADGYTVDDTSYDDNAAAYGNLYGSSKDVGTITNKIPALSETGGRVNRVGMKRIELEGTIEKFGFFTEYTQESMDFDSDAELMMHLTGEVVKAANEMTEDQLQIDLLNNAGVVRYTGVATSVATLAPGATVTDPDAADASILNYADLVRLSIELDQNRTPKNTTLISGSRMVDTKVVNSARYMYIGSELIPTIMRMTDYHGNKAFIPVSQYASAGSVARGEIGAVDSFRFIVVPEMMHWEGAGAAVAAGTEETSVFRFGSAPDGATLNYNVYPALVVGDGAFTTIGFQTDGKSVKFKTKHVKPSENYSTQDPFGETGFYSIKWYYGFMVLRPERIALMYSLAEW